MNRRDRPRGKHLLLILLVFVTLMFVLSGASAQQNHTSCAGQYMNGTMTVTLHLDAVCDAFGGFDMEEWAGGSEPHSVCWLGEDHMPGLDGHCDPCPDNWQRCTPCSFGEIDCGPSTPDPQPTPTPGGLNRVPSKSRSTGEVFVAFLDWLTA